MFQDLLITIKAQANSFTKTEKAIANYVLSHASDVPYMSISELAAACHVGETSVFRLCRLLGKSGYQDFKMNLAHSLGQSMSGPQPNDCIVGDQDSEPEMIQKVLNNCVSMLYETHRLLDVKGIATATRWLVEAKHICFFGIGGSSSSAFDAQNRFLHFCPKSEYISDVHLQFMRASLMNAGDVAVFFSYSGSTKELLPSARAAKAAGSKIICISRFFSSPLAELSDLLLLCGGNEGPYQRGNLGAKISQLFLIELLSISYRLTDAANCTRCAASATRALWEDA